MLSLETKIDERTRRGMGEKTKYASTSTRARRQTAFNYRTDAIYISADRTQPIKI